MKLYLLSMATALSIATVFAHAGETGTHGGNHLKDRFLLAKAFALKVLADKQCETVFTRDQCEQMHSKLIQSGSLQWFEKDDQCLRGLVKGVEQCVTAHTTSEMSSPIVIDINSAQRTKISIEEAIILLVHEAGHAIGLSDALITDQKVIQLFSTQEFRNLKRLLLDINGQPMNEPGDGVSSQSCKILKEALEKIYDRDMIGSSGIARKGWDLVNRVRGEHDKFFDEVWDELGEKGRKDILDFLMTRTSALADDYSFNNDDIFYFAQKMSGYLTKTKSRLDEEGALQPARFVPAFDRDLHKHWVDVYYRNHVVKFEICTFHYEDTNLVNSTRFDECSSLAFSIPPYIDPSLPMRSNVDRRSFDNDGGSRSIIIQGQQYSFWNFPKREEWALKNIGYKCEKKLTEGGGHK